MNCKPIGIFGGTFDPIHHGHLRLAQEVLEQCDLAEVRFIPCGMPPHRGVPHASAQQRLEMVGLGVQGNSAFTLDDCEVLRSSPSYSLNTLQALREELGSELPLCLMLGADAFLKLHTWHCWRQLFDLTHLLVMQRAGERPLGNAINDADAILRSEYHARLVPAPRALNEAAAGLILVLDMPALEISATDIRRRCSDHKSIHYLLPSVVADYIQSNQLYK